MSQDNRGKATAGVDNISKLSPEQRLKLARKLVMNGFGGSCVDGLRIAIKMQKEPNKSVLM